MTVFPVAVNVAIVVSGALCGGRMRIVGARRLNR